MRRARALPYPSHFRRNINEIWFPRPWVLTLRGIRFRYNRSSVMNSLFRFSYRLGVKLI